MVGIVRPESFQLPDGFTVRDDGDTLEVRCEICGRITRYAIRSAEPTMVEAAAWGHLSVCVGNGRGV